MPNYRTARLHLRRQGIQIQKELNVFRCFNAWIEMFNADEDKKKVTIPNLVMQKSWKRFQEIPLKTLKKKNKLERIRQQHKKRKFAIQINTMRSQEIKVQSTLPTI